MANSEMVSAKERQIAENRRTKPLAMLWSVPQFFCFSEKMISLDLLDIHFAIFYDFSQYLVKISLHCLKSMEYEFGGSNVSSL